MAAIEELSPAGPVSTRPPEDEIDDDEDEDVSGETYSYVLVLIWMACLANRADGALLAS